MNKYSTHKYNHETKSPYLQFISPLVFKLRIFAKDWDDRLCLGYFFTQSVTIHAPSYLKL